MIRKIISIAVVSCCVLVAWIWIEKRNAHVVNPPLGATNLLMFLEVRPEYAEIRRFTNEGNVYFEVVGKRPSSALVSGPPVYIFDRTGAFVDWSRDIGDQPSFVAKWGALSNATPVSIEAAKQLMKVREP